jgi:ribonuclease R
MTERRADDASRDVVNWLKAHYMQDRVGDEFDGTISGVTNFGLFVTLDGLAIDGLVHITELGRDYFHFDAGRHALVGERSGAVYQLAGRIRVKVARVDLEQAKIDFTLAQEQPSRPPQERPVFAEPLSRESRPRSSRKR